MPITKSFKYKSTIDWIELEVITVNDTNFSAIKRIFNVPHVTPINKTAGGAASHFKLKMHDISSWKALEDVINEAKSLKPILTVNIIGIEISFDAFSLNNDKTELMEKVADFYWLLQYPSSKNHRLAGAGKGSAEGVGNQNFNYRKIASGKSIYLGNQKSDPYSQRIYYKTKDKNQDLPIEHHSARYEIILRDDALPFRTVEEAKEFSFTKFTKYFNFRKTDENISAYMLMLVKAKRQLGKVDIIRIAGGGTKINSIGTKADITLNQAIYNKFRELNLRLRKT